MSSTPHAHAKTHWPPSRRDNTRIDLEVNLAFIRYFAPFPRFPRIPSLPLLPGIEDR